MLALGLYMLFDKHKFLGSVSMIKYVSGDILLTEADAMAHGVAPHDDFKQGLALSIRENWPSLYKDFRHFCKTKSPKTGTMWYWKGAGGPGIYNMFTQEPAKSMGSHPGKASLSHVAHCLKDLSKTIREDDVKSISITKVATGVGGLDWVDVKPLLQEYLGSLDIKVYVYEEFKKDLKAVEN